MLFEQRFIPGLAIASYLVGDEKSGEAAVIDPTRDVDFYIQFANQHGLRIRHIIETHVHADFVCGSRELKARLDDEPAIHCSGYGGEDWKQHFADYQVAAGDSIEMGKLRLQFHHMPGHTPEHITVALYDTSRSSDTPWLLFSGDFLFVGDVGRPDLLGEEQKRELAHELYNSVFQRLEELPDTTEVFPAHGAGSLCGKAIGSRRSSTIGYERQFNTSLQQKPEQQWVEDLLEQMPLSPPYFKRMKRVNKEGPTLLGPTTVGQNRWTAKQVREQSCEECLVLDVRSKEAFAATHIPNAINIPLGDNLSTWAGWVLPYDCPILLVANEPSDIDHVVTQLQRVGFDDVCGYLEDGVDAWETAGYELSKLKTISVQELAQRKSNDPITVVDVRTEKEWNDGHIEDAIHIHGGMLPDRIEKIDRDKPIAVVCGSGYRASIASSLLKREGFDDVSNVMGGMSAWKAAELPTT